MKIIKEHYESQSVDAMKDGDIAVITNWEAASYEGRVVQRYGDHLVALGLPSGNCWSDFFSTDRSMVSPGRVRILAQGTQLELQDAQEE